MHCVLNSTYEQLRADSDRLQFLIHNRCTLQPCGPGWVVEHPDRGGLTGCGNKDARTAIDSMMRERKNG